MLPSFHDVQGDSSVDFQAHLPISLDVWLNVVLVPCALQISWCEPGVTAYMTPLQGNCRRFSVIADDVDEHSGECKVFSDLIGIPSAAVYVHIE